MEKINQDSLVLVYYDESKRWLVRPRETQKLHTHLGFIDMNSVIGLEYGSRVVTNKGKSLVLLRPTIEDVIIKFSRKTQIIYPKDLSYICLKCSIGPGSVVIEAGTGSGATTAYISYIVGREGHVYSFDVNKEYIENATRNLERAGLGKNVTFEQRDVKTGFGVSNADSAIIDMPDPWEVVDKLSISLKKCSVSCFILPSANQVQKLVPALEKNNFVDTSVVEIMLRKIQVREGIFRPSSRMIGHTAYLVFSRNC